MIREGRLGKDFDPDIARFTSSLNFDKKLFEYDVIGSLAHCVMLYENGIIDRDSAVDILAGLVELLKKGISALELNPEAEDVHMAIEGYLHKKIGDEAGRLHTARSRNDQVATDLRLWVRDEVNMTIRAALELCRAIVDIAADNATTLFPGYTHLQRAQVTTLGHLLIAHCDSFFRDVERLEETYNRINRNPLGAAALATSSFPVDRELTAELLGFEGIMENSADAVSSRDFIHESQAALSILMTNLSRLCEELILWSSSEFAFVELNDKHASTSSIMPQKKNPDPLEVIRAKSARVIGNLTASLSLQKSLPLTYNRDLQELSPLLADSFATCRNSLRIMANILRGLTVNRERAFEACRRGNLTSTDLVEHLVRKGIPFRKAHKIVGRCVAISLKEKKEINGELVSSVAEKEGVSLDFGPDEVESILRPERSVEVKNVIGGPAWKEVERMLILRRETIKEKMKNLKNRENAIKKARKRLCESVDRILEV